MCTMKTLRMVAGRTYFKIRDRAIFVKLFSSTSAAVVVVVWSGSLRSPPPPRPPPPSLLHHVPRKVLSSDTQLTVNLSHAWPAVINLASRCICFMFDQNVVLVPLHVFPAASVAWPRLLNWWVFAVTRQ